MFDKISFILWLLTSAVAWFYLGYFWAIYKNRHAIRAWLQQGFSALDYQNQLYQRNRGQQ